MSAPAVVAVVLAGCAGAAMPVIRSHRLDRLGRADIGRRNRHGFLGQGQLSWMAGPAGAAALAGLTGRWPVALATAVAVHCAVRAAATRAFARRESGRREQAVELLSAFGGDLASGAPARSALAAAAGPLLPDLAAVALRPAADPAAALHALGEAAGFEPLADLAVAWRLAESTGAALVGPVASLTVAARADEAVRRELAAQLAGPRATALLLSLLPVGGVLLGTALGADPLGFLLGTTTGSICLLAGTALVAGGMWWTEAIVTAAARP